MTSHDPEHDRLYETAGLYVLDALEPRERETFEAHMRSCALCAADVQSLRAVAGALPHALPLVEPTPSLRARVMAAAGAPPAAASSQVVHLPQAAGKDHPAATFLRTPGWLSAAALLLLSLGLGGYSLVLRGEIRDLRSELQDALSRLDRSETQVAVATRSVQLADARMAVLTAPDLTQFNLRGQSVAPAATGRAFLSRARGLMFTASNLPPLPAGRTYQLWIVTPRAPLSAGLLQPDDSGRVAQTFDAPSNLPASIVIAVTDEPAGGVAAPTGEKYLVGQ